MDSRDTVIYIDHFPDVAGGQTALLTRLDELDRTEWEPVVVVPKVRGRLHDELDDRAVRTVPIQLNAGDIRQTNEKEILTRPLSLAANVPVVLRASKRLIDIFRNEDAALIHANSFKGAVYATLPARLTGTPLVHHAHSSRAYSDHGLLDHYVCHNATTIVANSAFTADTFERWSGKTRVIYNPIDTETFDPARADGDAVRSEFAATDTPLVGQVARLTPRKRQEDLVAAVPEIRETHPDAQVLLVGGKYEGLGAYEREIRDMIDRLGVGDAVTITGFREDIVSTIAGLDALVLPSLKEPLGRVLIEAQLLETPVVATDAGGAPEVVADRETGLLVPERTPAAIADAVTQLLDDPEWGHELATRGREQALSRFDSRRIVEEFETLYREVLGR